MLRVGGQAAASERIFEFLEEREETPDEKDMFPENPDGTVTFEHVQFGYVPGKLLISDLTAKIEPGYKIAIVGPTGAGKTTLVNLLLRFYDVSGGKISINGVSIKDAQIILYMQDGDIRESGTHDELMQRGKLYAALYNSQF